MAEISGMCKKRFFFFSPPLSEQSLQSSPSIFSCSEPPRFISKLTSLTVVAGEPAELQASIEGAQPISVQWLKEKEVIRESENIKITFVENIATLQFAKTEPANAGKYICQVKNDGGMRENMATLTVLGWYSGALTDTTSCYNESLADSCRISSWGHNDHQLLERCKG